MASISLSSSEVAAAEDLTPTLPFGADGASETYVEYVGCIYFFHA